MKTEMTTVFWGERCGVRANWAEAADQIYSLDGDGNWTPTPYQVAIFRHNPRAALQCILEGIVRDGGDDPDECTDEIYAATKDAAY